MSEQDRTLAELRAAIERRVLAAAGAEYDHLRFRRIGPEKMAALDDSRIAVNAELAAVEARIGRLDALTETAELLAAQLDYLLSRGLVDDHLWVCLTRRQAESFVAAVLKALRDQS